LHAWRDPTLIRSRLRKARNYTRKPVHGYHDATKQYDQWTTKEEDLLKKFIEEGKNSEQIALALGRTRAAISAHKSKMGIKTRITAATGSTLPYNAFSKEKREEQEQAPAPQNLELVVTPLETVEDSPLSIGQQVDNLISAAKAMGISLKIELGI